jgi:hypothetical protein
MSKILKNTTASPIIISDTGVTIPASPGIYTIPSQDYLLWAASSNVVTNIGSGDIIVNDGSSDLDISQGTDLIKGIFPSQVNVNQNTSPWYVKDDDVYIVLQSIASALGVTTAGILKQAEYTLPSKTETDIPGITYTVPTGKKFLLTSFMGSYDAQTTIHLRFKKQTGGVGAWNQLFRITLEVGGQGQSTIPLNFGNGIYIGEAGDKFKITGEASNSNKGTVWACFTGAEV